jgi:hypothetical protein
LTASKSGMRVCASSKDLPNFLPDIELHHGEALWVLAELGFQGGATKSTFYEYIKSLRRLGTPFERGKIGLARRGLANYSYYHLMELALVLTLRVYHVVPDAVLVKIARYRRHLYRQYRRAYEDRWSGLGAPTVIHAVADGPIHMRGAFLDLQMTFSGGKLVNFGPPTLLSPFEAITTFAERDFVARAFLPINLSLLSERLVLTALGAPLIRSGPRSTVKRGLTSRSRMP